MKRTVNGVEYNVVPSTRCQSNIGQIQCAAFHSPMACEEYKCMGHFNDGVDVCFLDDARYTLWLTAKLTA